MENQSASLVLFNHAMNMANNIVSEEIEVTGHRIAAIKKISILADFIEKNTSETSHPIIHFLSGYDNEGLERISVDLALVLSQQQNKKVLFIDACSKSTSGLLKELRKQSDISINDLCLNNTPNRTPFLNIAGTSFFYAPLASFKENENQSIDITTLKKFMMAARSNFDYIVIASESVIKNEYPYNFINLATLNILVASAKKSRTPVMEHMNKKIGDMNGKISGTILTGRKFFIPNIIYRLFFSK